MFVDDTSIIQNSRTGALETNSRRCVNDLCNWFNNNGSFFNSSKIFDFTIGKALSTQILTLKQTTRRYLPKMSETKFLELIIIHENFSGKPYRLVAAKHNVACGIRQLRNVLNKRHLLMFFFIKVETISHYVIGF